MKRNSIRTEAIKAFHRGYVLQRQGKLQEAIYQYKRSLELVPTAEAYTFLGWAYSFQDRLEDAIRECYKAIRVDPTLGNPYNDIGAYLIEMGRPEDALHWLMLALQAKRYESRCYPYYNLGRSSELIGSPAKALEYYKKALKENPSFTPAVLAVQKYSKPIPK
jgi:Tfp pilus assembly protein PilF